MKMNPDAPAKADATKTDRLWRGDPYAQSFPELRYDGWVEPILVKETRALRKQCP